MNLSHQHHILSILTGDGEGDGDGGGVGDGETPGDGDSPGLGDCINQQMNTRGWRFNLCLSGSESETEMHPSMPWSAKLLNQSAMFGVQHCY
jgi:hypothetical protein